MATVSNMVPTGIGESSAIFRVSGDEGGGIIYYAVRTSAPYGAGDQSAIKAGTGADWYNSGPNAVRASILATGLTPASVQYAGCYVDDGVESPVTTAQFNTQSAQPEPVRGKQRARLVG